MKMKKSVIVVSLVAALAVTASGVAIVSAQKVKDESYNPFHIQGLLTSEEYQELKEHPERQPSKEAKPAVPEEEQRLIDAKRDQLVDLYHESYDRHLKEFEEKIKEDSENEWIFEGEARAGADEDMAKFEKSIYLSFNPANALLTPEEVLNLTAYANPNATYAGLVGILDHMTIEDIK